MLIAQTLKWHFKLSAHNPTGLQFQVEAGGSLAGSIEVPGDKSMSHRSVMFGSMANGITEVSGFLEGEDALHTLQAFEQMGVKIDQLGAGNLVIHGQGIKGLHAPKEPIYHGNAGTGMRLLAGVLAGLGLPAILTGDESLSGRPMGRIVDPLKLMGANITTADNGTPPLNLHGGKQLKAIEYTTPMASAQVKSCILLAGLHAQGHTVVHEPDITRDHTERMLRGFGVDVQTNGLTASIEGGQQLKATNLTVPGDISSAAFFLVGAAMIPGSVLTINNVGLNPSRRGVVDILRLMGANIEENNPRESGGELVADLKVTGTQLKGIDVPKELVSLAIDEFPALFVAAASAQGTTVVTGAEELRVKETDRIQVMADGLRLLGVDITDTPDGARIVGGAINGGTVDSCGDHRTAMSFAMAALIAKEPITVLDCDNVATSFPGFVSLASGAGLRVSESRPSG